MEYIYIGDVVNTHGIKGEVRILTDFKYKDAVFKKGINLYVGRKKDKLMINTHRLHKNYDMVTFDGITSIDDVIIYKGDKVYINKKEIEIDGYFNEDIIGLDVYNSDNYIGKVEYVLENKAHEILVIVNEGHKHMIPYISDFVKNISLDKKRIDVEVIEGMLDDN
ncbi:MAG: ribosome maturation factor RimM [Bacilli bacterium]|nr:ribosome maturation factor RimM [Bacilli bacterium]